jgi:negative regulator of flagellin synthesis FlgM
MEIHGAGGPQGPQPISPRLASFSVESAANAPAAAPKDQVEISQLGLVLDGIHSLPEIRHEKVEAIRQQIAEGTYETPEKLDRALDNLLSELSGF